MAVPFRTALVESLPVDAADLAELTVAQATAWHAANARIVAAFNALTAPQRSTVRGGLRDMGLGATSLAALLPVKARGRPALPVPAPGEAPKPKPKAGFWGIVSVPARAAIVAELADALGGTALEATTAEFWTAERASAAADAIVRAYPNPSSATGLLGKLRIALRGLLVADGVERATLRPEITALHNQRGAERLAQAIAAGNEIPDAYKYLGEFRDRVRAWLQNPAATPQGAADFLVAFSARPGEEASLTLNEKTGTVSGMLKKRGEAPAEGVPVVSALNHDELYDLYRKWRALPKEDRARAMTGLTPLVAGMGIQRRNLRAVGAYLAGVAADPANPAEADRIRVAALRHAVGRIRPAEHYARFEDDEIAQLCARLRAATREQRAEALRKVGRIIPAA